MLTDKEIIVEDKTGPWEIVPYQVTDKKQENEDTFTFLLEPDGEKILAHPKPGQFNMIYVFGVGDIPISISSLFYQEPAICHTVRSLGYVSESIAALKVNEVIGIRGPYGTIWPVEKGKKKDVVIIAGGLGLAPLRPAIEQVIATREDYGNINVLFGTRNPEAMMFHKDIISWIADPEINFHITVDHATRNWHGNIGVAPQLVDRAEFDPESSIAMVCGPEIMMRFTVQKLLDKGMPEKDVYLSLERNMKCAFGHCGHCQFGPEFVCKDGAVFNYMHIGQYLDIREL